MQTLDKLLTEERILFKKRMDAYEHYRLLRNFFRSNNRPEVKRAFIEYREVLNAHAEKWGEVRAFEILRLQNDSLPF